LAPCGKSPNANIAEAAETTATISFFICFLLVFRLKFKCLFFLYSDIIPKILLPRKGENEKIFTRMGEELRW
jgi:hypothetical protein